MRKKTTKQLLRERELQRLAKKKEFEAQYLEEKIKSKKSVNSQSSELFYSTSFSSKEHFVKSMLSYWDIEQPAIISGKYQDWNKFVSIYQQNFIEFTRQSYPNVIEELRAFTPFFNQLFGENQNNYMSIFDFRKEGIFVLNKHLTTYLNSLLVEDYPFLIFKPERGAFFRRFDYQWGVYKLLFLLCYLSFVNSDEEKKKEIYQDAIKLLLDSLMIKWTYFTNPNDIDESILQSLIVSKTHQICMKFLTNHKDYFISNVKQKFSESLKGISTNKEKSIEAFIALQIELFKWAERHNLEKDWVLKYAYYFLAQFSKDPNLKISEIKVESFYARSLAGFPFEFKFDGWLAGDETKEDYEKRLKASFESELESYFQVLAGGFDLRNTKRITKPKDPDFESIKWLIAWNESATYPQIAKFFGRATVTIENGIDLIVKNFDLPKRTGVKGRKKTTLISENSLSQIKAAKIP